MMKMQLPGVASDAFSNPQENKYLSGIAVCQCPEGPTKTKNVKILYSTRKKKKENS